MEIIKMFDTNTNIICNVVNRLVAYMSKAFKAICTYSVSTNVRNNEIVLEAFLLDKANEN
jgi:hypothetical protein